MKRVLVSVLLSITLQAFSGSIYAAAEANATESSAPGQSGSNAISREVSKLWDTATQYITTNGLKALFSMIAAAFIFYVGRWMAKVVSDLLEKGLNRAKVDHTLSKFIRNLTYFATLIFVVIAVLNQLGVATTSLVAVIGAAGLAVGLALQGSLSNFAAGVLLIIFKPFKVGDFIEVAGAKGVVQEIQIFTTILHSPDNVRIIIPNAQITGGNIINYTANDKRRVDMVIGISYGDDIAKAKQVITSVLLGDSRILRDPAPTVAVLGLADSSVNIAVRPWVKPTDYWPTQFDLNEKIKVSLGENGITIPFPQRDLHIRTGQLKA